MAADLTLVAGLFFGAFAITSLLTAWIELRWPIRALVFGGLSAVLLYEAQAMRPDGITFDDVPQAFMRLIHIAIY